MKIRWLLKPCIKATYNSFKKKVEKFSSHTRHLQYYEEDKKKWLNIPFVTEDETKPKKEIKHV